MLTIRKDSGINESVTNKVVGASNAKSARVERGGRFCPMKTFFGGGEDQKNASLYVQAFALQRGLRKRKKTKREPHFLL